jgi:hypothetical protein
MPRNRPANGRCWAIRLVGREVTVVLNGIRVINRQSIDGPTTIALDTNEAEPGPILLQGQSRAGGVPADCRVPALKKRALSEQKLAQILPGARARARRRIPLFRGAFGASAGMSRVGAQRR